MEIVHSKTLDFIPPGLKHRGSGIAFKDLFLGDEGTPENFLFTVTHQTVFFSPRHKHNFEQFRYALQGDVSLGPDIILREGELSYHPEGVEYGPQNDSEGERKVLILQFGGPSGQGFLSYAQLERGQEELNRLGRFEKGKYYAADGSEPKDGFQALWEYYSGRPLEYPPPRYNAPIIIKPANFAWTPVEGASGVYKKILGVFTERVTVAEMIKIEAGGRLQVAAQNAIQLFFVLKGEGQADGVNIEAESALRLQPGTGVSLTSVSSIEIIHFVLPMLSKPAQNGHAA